MLKAQAVGNAAHRIIGGYEQFFAALDKVRLNVLLRRTARQLAQQSRQVVG